MGQRSNANNTASVKDAQIKQGQGKEERVSVRGTKRRTNMQQQMMH
jgi:hypothetical protein